MGKIHQLPEDIAQRIAAGEVVVRPASVLKELIENSIDAQAQHIQVIVSSAGKELLQVIDDGVGIDKEDLLHAFSRHSTSKIKTDQDLFNLSTYGFRGEALASIASVSKVRLESTCREKSKGYAVEIEGGQVSSEVQEVSPVEGTSMSVRHLFYNVPARRKFLKSDHSEFKAIMNVFFDQAIMNIDIHFTLVHNGKKVIDLPVYSDLVQRVSEIYGKNLSQNLIQFYSEQESVCATGYASNASYSRSNRRAIRFFVNGRPVLDKFLSQSVHDLYSRILMKGRFPACFLFISLPRDQVDVNVHPAKTEIKFVNEYLVKKVVNQALKNMFDELAQVESVSDESEQSSVTPVHSETSTEKKETVQEDFSSDVVHSSSLPLKDLNVLPTSQENSPKNSVDSSVNYKNFFSSSNPSDIQKKAPDLASDYLKKKGDLIPEKRNQTYKKTVPSLHSSFSNQTPAFKQSQYSSESRLNPQRQMLLNPCSSHHATETCPSSLLNLNNEKKLIHEDLFRVRELYVINENKQGLVILDQHAVHERVLYERFKALHLNKDTMLSQSLLFPIEMKMLPDELALFECIQETLVQMGFDIKVNQALQINKVPVLVKDKDIESILYGLLDDISLWGEEKVKEESPEKFDFVIATMACRSAIKSGDSVSRKEWELILEELSSCQDPHTCPHGRPTQIVIPFAEIERKFRRLKI